MVIAQVVDSLVNGSNVFLDDEQRVRSSSSQNVDAH